MKITRRIIQFEECFKKKCYTEYIRLNYSLESCLSDAFYQEHK
jgi:hypothetical protein